MKLVGVWLAAVLLFGCGASAADSSAEAVIARTKAPTTDYSLFVWTVINPDQSDIVDGWTAEFHSGSRHRVETPWNRVVADCAAMTGRHLHLPTGEVRTGREVANSACGIDTNMVAGMKYVGKAESGYGQLDIVSLNSDADRTYWVDRDGILVRTEFTRPGQPEAWVLRNWAVHVDRTTPDSAMFADDSLSRSYVPEKYRVRIAPDHPLEFDGE
ncbi:hypothetical protein [Sphingopyxis sp. PET50]|uniref:hypothetical protein n=1 Tax=Sphingopyxis sp. PET50 TaxID=2976533 RepID=UPI0021AFD44E|nr:hypothetical protein [Sphingopyxis sp. PET50]